MTLAEQSIPALAELLAGLEEADRASGGALLRGLDPARILEGLVAAILRLALLLHAEARRPAGDRRPLAGATWIELDQRFRALAGRPERHTGPLLDPDAYPFLAAPLADHVTARVLALLTREGDTPIDHADLPLESLGTLYESLISLGLTVAPGATIAVEPDHTLIDLDALLALAPDDRPAAVDALLGGKLSPRVRRSLAAAASIAELAAVFDRRLSPRTPAPVPKGALVLAPTPARRRSGSHYTPPELTRSVVEATLAPLVEGADPDRLLALAVCDPSMGSGAFLLEACRTLADRLLAARGVAVEIDPGARPPARREIAERCLYGVDRDPTAVELSRASLWLLAGAPGPAGAFLAGHLRAGDSLIGAPAGDRASFPEAAYRRDEAPAAEREALRARLDATPPVRPGPGQLALFDAASALAPRREPVDPEADLRRADAWTALWLWPVDHAAIAPAPPAYAAYLDAAVRADPSDPAAELAAAIARRERFLHWHLAFPEIFARGGFDALVGNPPWVAYAGRAAQPLAAAIFNFYLRHSPAFFGYRTLHGLFVHKAATLLRPEGRLGLVVPTSLSDLGGYQAVRSAHDELCRADDDLPDFGADAFEGVFQPAMALLSTRRSAPHKAPTTSAWPIARTDLDPEAARLLERLSSLPPLPAALFGERGFQSSADDARHLRALDHPEPPFVIPLREGRDLGAFVARPPRLHLDPRGPGERLRSLDAYREVKLFLRQTARYPIAALGDGLPFRNSILAGFSDDDHDPFFLLGYLNTAPVRWFHFMRFRDARQGMPQVKIAHLRALPEPPCPGDTRARLISIGHELGRENRGIRDAEAHALDALAAAALGLSDAELALVRAWAADHPLPKSSYDGV